MPAKKRQKVRKPAKKTEPAVAGPAGGKAPPSAEMTAGFVRKRKVSEEFAVLHDMAQALTSALDVEELLLTIMQKVEMLLSPDTWSLLLVEEETSELSFQIVKGKSSEKLRGARLNINKGIAGWVAMNGESLIVPDVQSDPRFYPDIDQITDQKTHSIVCVPVKYRDKALGVLEIVNYAGHRDFDDLDLELLEAMADYTAIALQNAIFVKKIHELTITDDLTGLYNTRQFHDVLARELSRAKRYAFQFSLLFIDMDHFKQVNDKHGHLIGSRMIHDVGQVIKEILRDSDYGFRYGGDEFVLLLPHTDTRGAITIGRRFQERLGEETFMVEEGLNLKIGASIGVASYPVDADTKEDLVRLADEAMYRVKATSRGEVATASDRPNR